MRTIVKLALASVVLVAAMLSAQNTGYEQDANWRPPAEAIAKKNPLRARPEATAGGEKLFKRNCVECHGDDGAGLVKKHAADLQLAKVQEQSDGALFWKITNGNPDRGMPPFSRLPELQRWQLVLYVRKLGASK